MTKVELITKILELNPELEKNKLWGINRSTLSDMLVKMKNEPKITKYYIHLYDYEEGTAIFESEFFKTEKLALKFARSCNFKVSTNVNVELMTARFEGEDCEYVEFNRNLEPFEYGRI